MTVTGIMINSVRMHRSTIRPRKVLPVPSIRVLVVEDDEQFRRLICSTLEKKPEVQVVGIVSDGLEAVQKAEEVQPDLIVLDIGLPTLSGIEAARRIPSEQVVIVVQSKRVHGARSTTLSITCRC